MQKNYRIAYLACCLGYVTQAAVVNLTPILFIPLREQYGFTFAQLGALVLINFFTQFLADVCCSALIDRLGFRLFAVAGHVCAAAGFVLFAAVPFLPFQPYYGFVAATVLFSLGGGALELVISPIVNALPSDKKSASMSLMHSFYCWGQVSVALLTTLFLFVFGKQAWPAAVLIWTLLPLSNTVVFLRCPLAKPIPAEHREPVGSVLKNPLFILLFWVILCAGATEITLSQWTSTFMEDVLGLPKVIGDTAGMCAFAVMMGVGRVIYGLKGSSASPHKLMLAGAALSFVCYITVALAPWAAAGLVACALCGLGVSLLWPGALSLSVDAFPRAGSWMLAIMAAAGDTGASVGPWLAGVIADGAGLRISLLICAVFPLGVLLCLIGAKKRADTVRPGSAS